MEFKGQSVLENDICRPQHAIFAAYQEQINVSNTFRTDSATIKLNRFYFLEPKLFGFPKYSLVSFPCVFKN